MLLFGVDPVGFLSLRLLVLLRNTQNISVYNCQDHLFYFDTVSKAVGLTFLICFHLLGIQALLSVLDKFRVENRRNMFVIKETKSAAIFYIRFFIV